MDRQGATSFAVIFTVLIASLCPLGVKADGTGASTTIDASPKRAERQDQVVVAARKEKLRELTQEVAKSEDAFFDAYNRVNTIREFDVHCNVVTSTGTLFSSRMCTPRFAQDAREDEAKATLEALTVSSTGATSEGLATIPHGIPANQVINGKYSDYKKHLVDVVLKDETLRKMLGEYEALKRRYDAALKE